jgi:hypothetical protein
MSKIHSLLAKIQAPFRTFTLTTPVAIIIAAFILGASHIAYGMVAGTGAASTPNIHVCGQTTRRQGSY